MFPNGLEAAYLERVRDVLMACTRERCWGPLLIEHLGLLLLRIVILDHHIMSLIIKIVKRSGSRANHSCVVELIALVLHYVHQLVLC